MEERALSAPCWPSARSIAAINGRSCTSFIVCGVEGPFGKLRAGSAVSLRQEERRKAFSRCRLYSENSLKRCCRSERTGGPSTAFVVRFANDNFAQDDSGGMGITTLPAVFQSTARNRCCLSLVVYHFERLAEPALSEVEGPSSVSAKGLCMGTARLTYSSRTASRGRKCRYRRPSAPHSRANGGHLASLFQFRNKAMKVSLPSHVPSRTHPELVMLAFGKGGRAPTSSGEKATQVTSTPSE